MPFKISIISYTINSNQLLRINLHL